MRFLLAAHPPGQNNKRGESVAHNFQIKGVQELREMCSAPLRAAAPEFTGGGGGATVTSGGDGRPSETIRLKVALLTCRLAARSPTRSN